MGLLHPTRWKELAPEFEAYEHIRAAREAIKEANPSVAIALDNAARYLHPRVIDPAGQAEFDDLKAGRVPSSDVTSPVAGGAAPAGRYSQQDLDRAVADALRKRDAGTGEGG